MHAAHPDLMGEVQPEHGQRRTTAEHFVGGFGIRVHVEFGDSRHVSHPLG